MLTAPLTTLAAWTSHIASANVPVLRRSRRALDRLALDVDRVSARDLAVIAMDDPFLTTKVFAYMAAHRSQRQLTDVTSVEGCVLMIGVPPFFRAFAELPTVEDQLKGYVPALKGVLRVIRRSRRAAAFAWDFAKWRTDLEIEQIANATLLHGLADMLMYCFAPALMLRIETMHKEQPTRRSRSIQREVLGIELHELQLALAQRWHLPELMVTLMDSQNAEHPRVRNVLCAVNLARHSVRGWIDPALPDDYRDIAALLNADPAFVQSQLESGRGLASGR